MIICFTIILMKYPSFSFVPMIPEVKFRWYTKSGTCGLKVWEFCASDSSRSIYTISTKGLADVTSRVPKVFEQQECSVGLTTDIWIVFIRQNASLVYGEQACFNFEMSSSTATPDSRSDGTYYQMSLRTDRPIESCELSPYPFLYLKGGNLDNAARQKKMDSNPYKFDYRWFRGPRKRICQNESCPRGSTYDPVYWSKAAIGGASLRCATCEKAGVAGHLSLFCSTG